MTQTQIATAMRHVSNAQARIDVYTNAIAEYSATINANPALPSIADGVFTDTQLRQAAERGKALEIRANMQGLLTEAIADKERAIAALARYTS